MITKVCIQCKRRYEASTVAFYKQKSNRDGLKKECKRCCRLNATRRRKPSGFTELSEQEKKSRDKNRQLFITYGITLSRYNLMFENQKGCCVICNKHQTELSHVLYVEHNHKTGKVRGLSCSHCNQLIDVYEKDFYGFKERIADYLRSNDG